MNNTIKIKTSWDEVTLSEFLAIAEIKNDEELKEANILRATKMIAALSNKSEKEVLSYSRDMFATLLPKITFIFNQDAKDLSGKPFLVGGVKYMFIKDFNNLSTGEMVSVETLLSQASKDQKSYLPGLLAILIRPAIEYKTETGKKRFKVKEFDAEDLAEREELFLRELKVPYFADRISAFMLGTKTLNEITNPFSVSTNQIKKEIEKSLGL
jgi:hypothetical protein